MKQQEIGEVTDWSGSTVSRKLQKLESTGDITRRQLDREKVVYLPGHEPDELASPLAQADEDSDLAE